MYCGSCGAKAERKAQFCIACGKPLTIVEVVSKELAPPTNVEAEAPLKQGGLSSQITRGFRISTLIILWLAVPMCYGLLAFTGYATGGLEASAIADPVMRRTLAGITFWTILGSGGLISMYAKRRKWLWFFAGCAGGWIVGVTVAYIAGVASRL